MLEKEFNKAILFPFGSYKENISGIAHLFEHVFLRKVNGIFGFTTEDYIFIFMDDKGLFNTKGIFKNIRIKKRELFIDKMAILNEIKIGQKSYKEYFFERAWNNNRYSKSPLGSREGIISVSISDIYKIIDYILLNGYYFIDNLFNLYFIKHNNIIKKDIFNNEILKKNINMIGQKIIDKYMIFTIKNGAEELYFIEKLLRLKNSSKHIQLIEKKDLNTLIIEKGCIMPNKSEISKLSRIAFRSIMKDIAIIKSNFIDRAINELESVYFYNISWSKRTERLFSITENDINNIIEKIPFLERTEK